MSAPGSRFKDRIPVTAAAARTAGVPVVEETFAGFPVTDAAPGAQYILDIEQKVRDIPTISGAAKGDIVFIDETTHALTRRTAASIVAQATLNTGVVGSNNAITWTAREPGPAGNALSITLIDPPGNNVALSVDVDGDDIVVTLATDGASVVTSTAAQVIAAILEHDTASQLVTAANTGASNGTGVVAAVAETNLAGATASLAGLRALAKIVALPGDEGTLSPPTGRIWALQLPQAAPTP